MSRAFVKETPVGGIRETLLAARARRSRLRRSRCRRRYSREQRPAIREARGERYGILLGREREAEPIPSSGSVPELNAKETAPYPARRQIPPIARQEIGEFFSGHPTRSPGDRSCNSSNLRRRWRRLLPSHCCSLLRSSSGYPAPFSRRAKRLPRRTTLPRSPHCVGAKSDHFAAADQWRSPDRASERTSILRTTAAASSRRRTVGLAGPGDEVFWRHDRRDRHRESNRTSCTLAAAQYPIAETSAW